MPPPLTPHDAKSSQNMEVSVGVVPDRNKWVIGPTFARWSFVLAESRWKHSSDCIAQDIRYLYLEGGPDQPRFLTPMRLQPSEALTPVSRALAFPRFLVAATGDSKLKVDISQSAPWSPRECVTLML
jgi:hypothetical protein